MNNTNTTNKTIRKATYTSDTIILIVGILLFIFIIIYIYRTFKSLTPVPTGTIAYTVCPDYWDSVGDGKCQNTNKLGTCSNIDGADMMDFSSDIFKNTNTGNYAKCRWAQSCKVAWGNIDRVC
jgi:hypothetical protein